MTQLVDAREDTGTPKSRRPHTIWIVLGLAVVWFLLGAAGGSYQSKLADVQKNDNAAYLPPSAESTKVSDELAKFSSLQTIPGFVVYQRTSGLTDADKQKITADAAAFRAIDGVAKDRVAPPTVKNSVASISVPLIGKQGSKSVDGPALVKTEKKVLAVARKGAPPGLTIHSAGPGGLIVAFIDSFQGIDGALILAAGLVVIIILLVVYRSPVLWFFPIFSAVMALGAAALFLYPLAKHDVLTLNGQSQGILSVLVIGAGTDYALLLISRYREELHNYKNPVDAMVRAWRGAAPAIAASAATVILGLLCLTFGRLNSDRSLGPVCAIGIGCTVFVMLTFLPAFLLASRVMAWLPLGWPLLAKNFRKYRLLEGRWIFWPRIPRADHTADIATHGAWGRVARKVGRNARRSWLVTAVVLIACAFAVTGLKSNGLKVTDSFTNTPDALVGQKIYDTNFNAGAGAPAQITANEAKAAAVIAAVQNVRGVGTGGADPSQQGGAVCRSLDYALVAKAVARGQTPVLGQGCPPPQLQLPAVNGRVAIDAQLTDRYDTPAAAATIRQIRTVVHRVDSGAIVGGQTAVTIDAQDASRHDRNLIIPIILVVILVVLALLLRAILVPLLLIGTVVLSFTASLGVSALVFNHVFHFASSDPGFPLFAFVFLVALGIDYNIFLMTRVREETLTHGTREGVLRGLAVTGGVITSAGLVLAATFTVLGVLPLVFLAELGFTVAFGVLLDTIVVRSILVPALSYDIGKKIWWPSRLAAAGAKD